MKDALLGHKLLAAVGGQVASLGCSPAPERWSPAGQRVPSHAPGRAGSPPVILRGGFVQDPSVPTTYFVRKQLKLPSEGSRNLCRSWIKARHLSISS